MDPVKVSDAGQRWNVDLNLMWDKFRSSSDWQYIQSSQGGVPLQEVMCQVVWRVVDANVNVSTEAVSEGGKSNGHLFQTGVRCQRVEIFIHLQ